MSFESERSDLDRRFHAPIEREVTKLLDRLDATYMTEFSYEYRGRWVRRDGSGIRAPVCPRCGIHVLFASAKHNPVSQTFMVTWKCGPVAMLRDVPEDVLLKDAGPDALRLALPAPPEDD